jgi:hypothetical protein
MSTIKVTTIQNLAGVEVYTAKAWVNFNGTGTVAIRASGNVSSITDNGTGDYTVNFTVAMVDTNYCVVVSSQAAAGAATTIYPFTQNNGSGSFSPVAPVVGSFRVSTAQSGSYTDLPYALVSVFR